MTEIQKLKSSVLETKHRFRGQRRSKLAKRLDESLDSRTLTKTLAGDSGAKIDLSKIKISPSGQVQPADSQQGLGGASKEGASKARA